MMALPLNSRMGAMGDSITAIGISFEIATHDGNVRGSHVGYGMILPPSGQSVGGGLIPDGINGATGARIQNVVDTHLPSMLARTPKVGICVVLIGSNDLEDILGYWETALYNLAYIYDTLIENNILPVACAVPTANGADPRANAIALNTEIESMASARSIPFADYFTATDDTGWKAGYTDDNIHPNSVGAKAMGQVLRDVIDPYLVSIPDLVASDTDTESSLLWQNGRNILDSDSDGDPDGGQVLTTNAWQRVTNGDDCEFSLVAEDGVVDGNWWRINKTANNGSSLLRTQSGDVSPNVVASNVIGYGFLLKVASADSTTRIDVWAQNRTDNSEVMYRISLRDLQAAIDPFKFYFEKAAPDGMSEIGMKIEIKDGLADVYIGQITIRLLNVATDDSRISAINSENRNKAIVNEDREIAINLEDRGFAIISEERGLAINSEDRILAVNE